MPAPKSTADYPAAGQLRRPGARRGLALREIIVVAGLVLLGLSFLFPYLLSERTAARRRLCERRQIAWGEAMQRFEEIRERYPAFRSPLTDQAENRRAFGWQAALLPFVAPPTANGASTQAWGEGPTPTAIYDELAVPGPHGSPPARGPDTIFLPLAICPDDMRLEGATRAAWTTFVANTGLPDVEPSAAGPADWPANGLLLDGLNTDVYPITAPDRKYIEDRDGLDYTLLLTENLDAGMWAEPTEASVGFVWMALLKNGQPDPGDQLLRINQGVGQGPGSYRAARPASWHPGGVNVVFCSGKTQFLSQKIDYLAFANLVNSSAAEGRQPGSQEPLPPPYRSLEGENPPGGGDQQ